MFRGVYSMPFDAAALPYNEVSNAAIALLKQEKVVKDGDWIILTKGEFFSDSGGTNGMKILKVGG